MDRQADGRTDARGKTICLPTLSGGDINSKKLYVIYFPEVEGCSMFRNERKRLELCYKVEAELCV